MEALTLTVAQSVPTYQVRSILFDWAQAFIQVIVRDAIGKDSSFQYYGATATNMMKVLNKADLSSNSLHRRVLNQLVSDGFLPAGSVTGSPD